MKHLLSTVALLAAAAPALADDQFSLTTGLDYSSGKYGNAQSTDIVYVPVTGQYETDNLTLKLTVPYISITGPGGVIQGVGRVASPTTPTTGMPSLGRPSRGGGTATTTNSGLGDIVASAGYTVYSADRLTLDAVGKVKFGTADANKGLGTGKNDYSAQLDGYYKLLERTTLFVTAGYKIVGAPAGTTANNVPYGMFGANQKLSDATSVGAMVSVARSAFTLGSNQQDVTVYAMQKLSRNLKLQASVLKGFANGSPDYGASLMITGYF